MKRNVLTLQYLSSFCMSMHLIMQAGIPLTEGILMLAEDERDSSRHALLLKIHEQLDRGESMSVALQGTDAFPKYVLDMVEIGERTGNLDRVLRSLSEYYENQEQIGKSIKNAIMYPAILMVIMFIVVVILITKVLPVFGDVYAQLGTQMSPAAQAVMNFGTAIEQNWIVISIIAAAVIALILACIFVKPMRAAIVKATARFHSEKSIGSIVAYTRFASTMAMTMSSGMDIDESLAMTENLIDNPTTRARIAKCRALMAEGSSFEDAINASGILPTLYCRMITIGIQTGSGDTVMSEIARRSELQANDRIESMVSKVEPSLVIIMSIIVGLILLSVMLPLANIMSTIG